MSDDGVGYGGGGDDYDYESGPGCVTPKNSKFLILLIMPFSTSDLMEHLCVSFFSLCRSCVFLVHGRSRTKAMTFLQTSCQKAKFLLKRRVRKLCMSAKTV